VNGQRVSARPGPREAAAEPAVPAGHAGTGPADDVLRAELPADLTSARQARAAVRQALAAWGMNDPSGDAELLASELVANASEHGGGPISLALRRQAAQDGKPGIACEVTDTSPDLPGQRQARPGAERGRGLAIVEALASSAGTRATDTGKTTWFTLALTDRAGRLTPHTQAQAEAEAGA
jgi:anti-sigma regulatory factor (Ser/Thr protein kinase)